MATRNWTVNGLSLTGVYRLDGVSDSEAAPPLRGDNVAIPGRAGRVWVPKVLDEHRFSLRVHVLNHSPTTNLEPAGGWEAAERQLNDNLLALKAALPAGVLFPVTRQRLVGGGSRTETAQCELDGRPLEATYNDDVGFLYARVVIRLVMPDPTWT